MAKQSNIVWRILRRIFILPILFYQKFIGPFFRSPCLYTPTCSTYSKDAILRFGIVKGGFMALARIIRCNGWLYDGGDDPLPENYSFAAVKEGYKKFRRPKRNRH